MGGESPLRSSPGRVTRIRWMLTRTLTKEPGRADETERPVPFYGELTAFNTSRLILDSVGTSLLSDLVGDLIDLLDTSCTVYEKNGDHALRLLSPSWCQVMDRASRQRCHTPDNREALQSGKWLCRESCWNEAARRAIELEEPVDVVCRGGIRLFAVPIFAGQEPIGSISIGYGDPPGELATLSDLAAAYGVPLDDLHRQAEAYNHRPQFLVELAKKRARSTARIIGDIVERKQAEQALCRSEEKFRALFDYAKDAVFIHDLEGRLLEVNQGACELLGYSHDELLKMGPLDIDTSERVAYRERMETLHRQGHLLFETVNRRRDGTLTPAEVSLQLFELAGRQVCLAVCRDVTDRKRAEAALVESEKRFSVFMEHLPAGVFIKDQQGRLLFANRFLKELFGWHNCIGKTTEELVPSEVAERMVADDRKALAEGPIVVQERVHDIHGREYFFDTYKFPIELNEAGSLLAGIAVDVSKRKRAEEALEKRVVALTQPLDAVEGIVFEDLFNLSELQRFQDLFAKMWGVAALITRPDGTPITQPSNFTYFCGEYIRKSEKGFRNCQTSDAKLGRHNPSGPIIEKCLSAGLCGAGASITVGGRHIASWLIGQVRNEAQTEEQIVAYARELGHDETEFREAFLRVPIMPQEKFEQIAHTLFVLANQLSSVAYQNIQQARFIAERKQAEEALRESERKLSEAQKMAQLGHWRWDVRTGEVEWSEEVFKIFHLDPQSYTPQIDSIMALSPWPDSHERHKELLRKSVTSHERGTFEQAFLRPDQSIGYYFSSFQGEYDHSGNLVSIVGTVQDITERKQAEEALRESEEKFRGIYEASPIGIELYDHEGTLLNANKACLDIFGITDAAIAEGFKLFEDPNLSEELKAQLRRGENVRYEMSFDFGKVSSLGLYETTKRGIIYLDLLITPLRDTTRASVIGYLVHMRDITERKQAEEERRSIEAQMREMQKLESLGVLAGGIAHDFNNLLMAILGRADLALLSLSPVSPAHHHLEEITRASQRAADLCRQMLAYSGKGRFVVGRRDLSEIVHEMGQLLEISVSKKAMVRYALTERLPAVESDATQIRQVIMNLITNASEALGDRGGTITVTTGVMECDETYLSESYVDDALPAGRYVFLEVSDTGCGMDAETRGRIFDPFFTTKFTGRGLGLAAVLGIVRGHKGAIKVYSEMGRGTTFKVLLPAAKSEPDEKIRSAEQNGPVPGGGTILVVDDDLLVLNVASEMLAQLGFQVLTAINGREGVEVFRAHRDEITCVILDLTMPVMGGEEAFRELRNVRSEVRVILSSGYNEQDVTQRFVGRGLAGFVQKPYTTAGLRRALMRALA